MGGQHAAGRTELEHPETGVGRLILTSWRIASEHGGARWWWVRVHDSPENLRESAYRRSQEDREFWKDAVLGCCQPVRPWTDGGELLIWPPNGLAGVIRLSAENLFTEVIYHELVHAACAVYRMNFARSVDLGTGLEDMAPEEDLAYIYGQLAADMDTELKAWWTRLRGAVEGA